MRACVLLHGAREINPLYNNIPVECLINVILPFLSIHDLDEKIQNVKFNKE